VRSDFRDEAAYFDTALDLLLSLYRVPPRHPAVAHWKQKLAADGLRRSVLGGAEESVS
jgi:hypothetical protein